MKHEFLVRVGHINPLESGRTFKVSAIDCIDAYNKAEKEIEEYEFIQGVYNFE